MLYGEELSACCETDMKDYVWLWCHGEKFRRDIDDVLVGHANGRMVYMDVNRRRVTWRGRY